MPRAHQCRLAQLAASSCRKSPRIERLARRRSAKRKGNLQPWLSCGLSRPLPGVERRLLEPLHGLGKGGCCARWGVEPLRSSRIHASTDDGLASWPNHSRAPKLREDPAWVLVHQFLPPARPGGSPLSYYPRRTSLSNGQTTPSNLTSPTRPAIVPSEHRNRIWLDGPSLAPWR